MSRQIRVLMVVGTGLFGISLLVAILSFSKTSHFSVLNNLLVPLVGIGVSLYLVSKPLWLVGATFMDNRLLRTYEQRIQQQPQNAAAYIDKVRIVMRIVSRDCERMEYFLAWDAAGTPARDIRPRITRNLEQIDTVVQILDTTSRLQLLDTLLKRGWGTTPFEVDLARNRLESFKHLFPQAVEQMSVDRPGYLLVEVLQRLCAAIALNPLYPDAFANGSHLMEYLHRDTSASHFQHLATSLEQALA